MERDLSSLSFPSFPCEKHLNASGQVGLAALGLVPINGCGAGLSCLHPASNGFSNDVRLNGLKGG
jgi:hypothetical protein